MQNINININSKYMCIRGITSINSNYLFFFGDVVEVVKVEKKKNYIRIAPYGVDPKIMHTAMRIDMFLENFKAME